ncbi:MAG: GNAT family N-acetyltransferase [Candidatus Hermodarchaeota archaeon]
MTYYKKLVGEKCYLSPYGLEDAEKWTEWLNDLKVTIPLGDEAYQPLPLGKLHHIINECIQNNSHMFNIVDLATDTLLGRGLLFNLDQVNRTAMIGLFIGEKDYWGKGYGQDASKLLLDYAFNLLNLNSIMLGAFSFNKRAIRCYKSIGFKEIGRRRQAKIIGRKTFDIVLMDMLAEEFHSVYVDELLREEE